MPGHARDAAAGAWARCAVLALPAVRRDGGVWESVGIMTIIVHDTFNVGSDTDLTAHTPDVGSAWAQLLITGTAVLRAFAASDDAGASASATSNGQVLKSQPDPPSAEYDVEFTLATVDTGSANRPIRLLARISDDSATSYYGVRLLPTGQALDDTELYKMVSGTKTSLGSVDTGITAGDVITLRVRNAAKEVLKNGVSILSSADNAITGAGRAGIAAGFVSATDIGNIHVNWRVDNYKVTTLDQPPRSMQQYRQRR